MSKKTYNHLHHYAALAPGSPIYRCTIEGCVHSINKLLLAGRKAECEFCNEVFTLTKEMLTRKTVHCGCKTRAKAAKTINDKTESILDLLGKVDELNRKDEKRADDNKATPDRTSLGIG